MSTGEPRRPGRPLARLTLRQVLEDPGEELERHGEDAQRRPDELDHDAFVSDVADIHLNPAIALPSSKRAY